MSSFGKVSDLIEVKSQQANIKLDDEWYKIKFLQEVIEILEDGVLILSMTGKVVYTNNSAYHFCCQLNQGTFDSNFVPLAIWNLCQILIDEQRSNSEKNVVFSDEIVLDKSTIAQIYVRSVNLEMFLTPCLLVVIKNGCQFFKKVVSTEIHKYDFTPREAEVWSLYRDNCTYKQIAAQLHITINTVKKHMKNIHAKRQ